MYKTCFSYGFDRHGSAARRICTLARPLGRAWVELLVCERWHPGPPLHRARMRRTAGGLDLLRRFRERSLESLLRVHQRGRPIRARRRRWPEWVVGHAGAICAGRRGCGLAEGGVRADAIVVLASCGRRDGELPRDLLARIRAHAIGVDRWRRRQVVARTGASHAAMVGSGAGQCVVRGSGPGEHKALT